MKLNSEIVVSMVRPAATVILLRDGAAELEVFLMKRHEKSNAFGGAYVFPGGKVDQLDVELAMDVHLDQTPAELHTALNEADLEPRTAASLYIAAVREVFEECGILFAQDATLAHVAQASNRLREGETFNTMLGHLNLRLQTHSLAPWSRWVTPPMPSMSNKRFDTRFFVAAAPCGQTALHDNHETTDSVWLSPRVALTQYQEGRIAMAPPQIMTLAHLSRYRTVDDVLAEARRRSPPLIEPKPIEHVGGRIVCYPGDVEHSVRLRAMPGPTRLQYSDNRFMPIEGFDALFE